MTLYVVNPNQDVIVNLTHDQPSSTAARSFVSPVTGRVLGYWVVNNASITGSTGYVSMQIGGTTVTNSSLNLSSAAAGTVQGPVTLTTGSAAVVTAGQAVAMVPDGGSSTALPLNFTLIIRK